MFKSSSDEENKDTPSEKGHVFNEAFDKDLLK